MLVLGSRFINTPIMSLQTGGTLGNVSHILLDPRNLKVVAFEIDGATLTERPSFLRVNDIREVSPLGFIIDDSDELIGLDDVIALKKLYALHFDIIDMPVIDEHKHKLGKVEDYTMEADGFVVQQLHVKRGLFRSLTDTGLLIHRSQIVEINDNEIIVKSTGKKQHAKPVTQETQLEYSNPFRGPSPQVEPVASDQNGAN